jgi:hypothetical protein
MKPTASPFRARLVTVAFACACALSGSSTTACGPAATPVTPAPLAAEEQQKLQAVIVGTWRWTQNEKPAGQREEIPGFLVTRFVFRPDGTCAYQARGIAFVNQEGTYHLEGRNVVTTMSSLREFRVETWGNAEVKAFSYWQSNTMIWRRES